MDDIFRMGMQVEGSDGVAGIVEDLLYDKDGNPAYLVVRDMGVFARDVVLPIAGATIKGDVVRYPMTKAEIHKAQRYDPDRFGPAAGFSSAAAGRYDQQDKDKDR